MGKEEVRNFLTPLTLLPPLVLYPDYSLKMTRNPVATQGVPIFGKYKTSLAKEGREGGGGDMHESTPILPSLARLFRRKNVTTGRILG